jgi:hypothetical protein
VTLLTIPATQSICRRFLSTKRVPLSRSKYYYEDEDGIATEESIKASSIPLQKFLVVLLSAAGLVFALSIAIIGVYEPRHGDLSFENWLQVATWVSAILR